MERQWIRLVSSYRLRSELPDPAREERRLAELHGDVARIAQRVEVRPRVQPGELLEVATADGVVVMVGVLVAEVVGRGGRGRGGGVEGCVGQSWKTRESCKLSECCDFCITSLKPAATASSILERRSVKFGN